MSPALKPMRLTVRDATVTDVPHCHEIESRCFAEAEAAPRSSIEKRQAQFPQGFLVAELDGRVIGLVNSAATHSLDLADEAFKDMVGHDEQGTDLVVFSVAIDPALQGRGYSIPLFEAFLDRARELGKARVHLLCKSHLLGYYYQFGFVDQGVSDSDHGGARWHAMTLALDTER